VHYRDFPVIASHFIWIIATINARYGAAILNDARRLECPKHPSLTIIFGTMTLGYRGYGARGS
jgi:hypothetical protein